MIRLLQNPVLSTITLLHQTVKVSLAVTALAATSACGMAQQKPGANTSVVGTWTANGKPGEKLTTVFKANKTWSAKSSVEKPDPQYDSGTWTQTGMTVTVKRKAKKALDTVYNLVKDGTKLKPTGDDAQFLPIYTRVK
jgi:hypothetical protein